MTPARIASPLALVALAMFAACAQDGTAACPAGAGPRMVRAGDFCIDRHEVTNADYARFLDATGGVPDLREPPCAWNDTLVPKVWPAPTPSTPEHPVVFVDWCDSDAYCRWAGKRLCGRIGGGSLALAERRDPRASQWMSACSGAGRVVYPYGDAYDRDACSGDAPTSYFVVVEKNPRCVGAYSDLHDLSGNVHEFEDACDPNPDVPDGSMDICSDRGGSFKHDASMLACGLTLDQDPRSGQWFDVGFRCCWP